MIDFSERIAGLSPEKRALFELQLMKKAPYAGKEQTIARRGTSEPCALSFAQQRLWFLDQLEPDSPIYNIGKAVRITGPLDLDALRRTLDTIVARHQVLRTTFTAVDGEPVQVVAPDRSAELTVIDLGHLPKTEQTTEVRQRVTEQLRRPFDLSADLMLRSSLLRLDAADHVLVMVMHHIASDGWSMGILSREIASLYDAFSTGRPASLPNLPIQYTDFSVWQKQYLQGSTYQTQLNYWREHLAALPVVELPTDRPRPPVQAFHGARQGMILPSGLCPALKALSRKEGVTLFMTLLAAFQTLLHRYAGLDNIVVGSPVAGRTRAETEELIGFFVNTLVLRTDLSGNPTFRELLKRVRDTALGAYAHQDLPFEKLVEELHPDRDLSRNPLFQIWFALQNVPRQTFQMSGLIAQPLDMDSGTAKFDLGLSMVEVGEDLRGTLEFNTDLFDATTITRMRSHFNTLIEGIVADPDKRLSDLPLLTDVEKNQLLVEWNATKRDYPKDQCVHHLFEIAAQRTPDAVAAAFEERQLTYRELDGRANQLANHLQKLGIGPGKLVGICVERSLEMIVGLFGILKAGGAYVPLDPAYPTERLEFMVADAQLPVLLTQQSLMPLLPPHQATVLCLDSDWKLIDQDKTSSPSTSVKPEDVAYVIFTSGSTGKPKGVRIPHGAVGNFLTSMRERPGLTERDILLAVTTLSFDIAALEIFLPLSVGARVVVASRDVASDGTQLTQALASSGATVMQATPATWRMLLDAGWQGHAQLKMLCGGEALPRELAAQLLSRGSSLWNMYGPTETTIWSAVHKVEAQDTIAPIGRPIANTEIYILDLKLQPVPVGIPGELHIGGDGLALGYLNRPDLTTEKFITHPYREGARLYKTGDLVRYQPDGNIEFLGRLDHQVKIRGYRIELGEIESALRQHATVQQVVALAREDTPGDKRLVAYIVTGEQPLPSVTELRDFLREKLPDYMVPSAFVFLDSFPLTPNGKIDRKALPQPDQTRSDSDTNFVAARDELEVKLTQIWEKVLNFKPIGLKDNFFEIGGHSLLAVRLFVQIDKTLGKNLPLATLFQAPTIEQLAQILRQKGWEPSWSSLVAIQPGGSKPPFYCVHAHDGNVLFYRDLALLLGKDQPLYGFQAQGLDGKQPLHRRLEDMATHYIKEIRAFQPQGPYYLGGFCFGGKVAYEMAQQLRAQGDEVALLALFDTYAPGKLKRLPFGEYLRAKISRHVADFLRMGARETAEYVWARLVDRTDALIKKVKRTLWRIGYQSYVSAGRPLPRALQNVAEAHLVAARGYMPQIYSGRLTLFRAIRQRARYYPDPLLGWSDLVAGELEAHEIAIGHDTMLSSPELAEKVRACLERAQRPAQRVL